MVPRSSRSPRADAPALPTASEEAVGPVDAGEPEPRAPVVLLPEPTDRGLALDAAAGDAAAFEALVRRYAAAVLAVVERRARDREEAQDHAQDVWLKVYRALPRYRPTGSFRSWIFSIALNHVRDARRRSDKSRLAFVPSFARPPSAPRECDPAGRTEERALLSAALAQVPEPFRAALVLVDVLGLAYAEAAASLACAVGTVKSRVSRGRLAFRAAYCALEDEGGEGGELSDDPRAGPAHRPRPGAAPAVSRPDTSPEVPR